MIDTVTVAITLPINGSALDRAQAMVAAIYQNGGVGAVALGQLLGDMRSYVDPVAATWPRQEIRFFGE
jgi:hypothetical protein